MRAFSYERAKSPAEAAKAVAGTEGAKFLAGGTNLLDLMKLEVETPTHLVDVQDIGLDRIEPTDEGGLRIGTLVTNTALASHERVRRDYAVLTRAIVAGASGQLRAARRDVVLAVHQRTIATAVATAELTSSSAG